MKRTILTSFTILSLLFATTACGEDDSIEQAVDQTVQQFEAAGVTDMKNDALFAAEATSASMLQVELGEEAVSGMAVSPEVQELAQELVRDHQQMLSELQQMASQSNFVLPSSLGENHQEVYSEVTAKSGLAFDLAYVDRLAGQYKNLIRRYEDIAQHGKSMELKQYASKQLPLLRKHRQLVEDLEDRIKNA
ncbi:MAG: DUF4142 domain-containing protein [Hymenobacteraceae bacterium]|nr:DUF4142 domain-containing protein [Hymenobacteraceae bacterium]